LTAWRRALILARYMRPSVLRCAAVLIGCVLLAALIDAQAGGVHPLSGRRYASVLSLQGAEWLERTERETEEDPTRALDLIDITAGETVADVGAGTGYFTVRLAARVGASGHVYANDIQPLFLKSIERRVAREHLANVTTVLGAVDDPKLPEGRIDVALLVDVYHELSEPQRMLQHLRRSLKPDGRLVLLEYRKEDPTIPIHPDHRMSIADVRLEVEAEGFHLASVNDDLPRHHIFKFSR
jgi:predicted methyltransferase